MRRVDGRLQNYGHRKLFGRLWCRRKDNIKVNLKEIGQKC
jgi:hypothetical protein